MTQTPKVISTDPYEEYIAKYRNEEPVKTVIAQALKIRLDKTVFIEIKGYRIYKTQDVKYIRGPEDYDTLLEILDNIQRMKDRVCEIQLTQMGLKHDLDNLYHIVYIYLWTKRELLSLRNDTQRYAIVSKTIPEVENLQKEVDKVIKAAERVIQNLNQTYNIAREQSYAITQKMYHRNLAMPGDPNQIKRS